MLLGMAQPQIDEARAELGALSADEQKLQALVTQKGEEITLHQQLLRHAQRSKTT